MSRMIFHSPIIINTEKKAEVVLPDAINYWFCPLSVLNANFEADCRPYIHIPHAGMEIFMTNNVS